MKESALAVETRDHESKVTMSGNKTDALVNWVTLTHAICTAYHIPPQALAFAIANGIVDEVGRCADSMTTLDLSQLFRGRGGGPK